MISFNKLCLKEGMKRAINNELLLKMYWCFKKWIKKIKKIGWSTAKKNNISPFENCSCRLILYSFPSKNK